MTAHSDLESAVASYRGGAFEYLPKPFDMDEAVRLARRAIEHRRRQKPDAGTLPEEVPEIVGEAPAMQEVFRAIGRLSRSNITVLINGESGTGKELVARALHRHSPRADGPFIALNIAAIPRELLESELFGHEKGAFTGAAAQRKGRFEQAHAGTLFLDEIGDMPAELQTRLLRVLSDGRFYRVGGHEQVETDVRIIAATNQDLESTRQGWALSRRPVPPSERDPHPPAAAACPARGHRAAGALLPQAICRRVGRGSETPVARNQRLSGASVLAR